MLPFALVLGGADMFVVICNATMSVGSLEFIMTLSDTSNFSILI
jgi:hypothetical protein